MLDSAAQERAFSQIVGIYVAPEIKRRKELGQLKDGFVLEAAQVVMSLDLLKPIIRLNDEARILGQVKLKANVSKKKGEMVFWNDIEEVCQLDLPKEEEPHYAHISIIRLGGVWFFSWDARYNKALARKHCETAQQYLLSAEHALQHELWGPFIDNLFSCVELLARSELLLFPDRRFKGRVSHGTIKSKYNDFVRIGNAKSSYAEILNKLAALRGSARYLRADFNLTSDETDKFVSIVKEMMEHVKRKLKSNYDSDK